MATTERDYYELLGVAAHADEAEIKRAFRGLARELHPDVSEEPDAEERFSEVVEAYEVLSKPETRELYDRYGHAGLRSGGFTPASFDFGSLADLFSAFFGDDLFGVARRRRRRAGPTSPPRSRSSSPRPRAASSARSRSRSPCPARPAGGRRRAGHRAGRLRRPAAAAAACSRSRAPRSASSSARQTARVAAARAASSSTRASTATAPAAVEERTLEVEVPAGIHDGQRIRISGEGHAGPLGGRAGDAYVHVRVRPDPRFVREGNDIFSTVDLTMTEAALGDEGRGADARRRARARPRARAPSPASCASCVAAGCRCCRASAAATSACSSTFRCPRPLTRSSAGCWSSSAHRRRGDLPSDEGFFEKLKSAFR